MNRNDCGALLFDFDGTLIDASRVICRSFNRALREIEEEPIPEFLIRSLIGRPLRDMYEEAGGGRPTEEFIAAYKRDFARLAPDESRLLPGADETIRHFSRQWKLGIVTSRTSAGTRTLLRHFGLESFFEAIVGFEDVTEHKPSPLPVEMALHQLGAASEKSTFVGDTVHDMRAGRAAGVRTIGITTGPHAEKELRLAGAERTISSLKELLQLFQE